MKTPYTDNDGNPLEDDPFGSEPNPDREWHMTGADGDAAEQEETQIEAEEPKEQERTTEDERLAINSYLAGLPPHPPCDDLELGEQPDGQNPLEAARSLVGGAAVFLPIPPQSKATTVQWKKLTLEDSKKPAYLKKFQPWTGVAVKLGKISANLCSIDLDTDELLAEFRELNVWTNQTLITRGSRGGNVWVTIDGEYPPLTRFPKMGEWRADGAYTILLGTHTNGNDYTVLNRATPVKINYKQIIWPKGIERYMAGKNTTTLNKSRNLFLSSYSSDNLKAETDNCNTENLKSDSCGTDNLKTEDCVSKTFNNDKTLKSVDCVIAKKAADIVERMGLINKSHANLEEWKARLTEEGRSDHFSLYQQQMATLCKPELGNRNASMVKAAPRLIAAASEAIALQLMMDFYRLNAHWFKDSEECHAKECKAMLSAAAKTIYQSFDPDSQTIYTAMDEEYRATFRVMRDLARNTSRGASKVPRRFFLSTRQLAARIGTSHMRAKQVIADFCLMGIVTALPEQRRNARHAMVFNWELSLPEDGATVSTTEGVK